MAGRKNQKSKVKNQKVIRFKDAPKKERTVAPKQKGIPKTIQEESQKTPVITFTSKFHGYWKGLPLKKYQVKDLFPKIFRSFTEIRLLTGVLLLVLFLGSIVLIASIRSKLQQRNVLEQRRTVIQGEVQKWQRITEKYPGYRDAYFQLALLEYQLGDFQSSQEYLTTVESLDPNFAPAYQLEKLLEK